jgi:hypothetical protein
VSGDLLCVGGWKAIVDDGGGCCGVMILWRRRDFIPDDSGSLPGAMARVR